MDASHPSRVRAFDATPHEPPFQLRIGEHSTAKLICSVNLVQFMKPDATSAPTSPRLGRHDPMLLATVVVVAVIAMVGIATYLIFSRVPSASGGLS